MLNKLTEDNSNNLRKTEEVNMYITRVYRSSGIYLMKLTLHQRLDIRGLAT